MLEFLATHWFLLCSTLFGLAVLWIVAVLSKYVRLMLNIFRDNPPPLLIGSFDYERIEGEHVDFRAFDGTCLHGMFLSREMLREETHEEQTVRDCVDSACSENRYLNDQTRGVIIFCHEYGSDMYSFARYCMPLLRAGFDIFTFDFRSHGKSALLPGYDPQVWCTDKEVSDCLGAIAYVRAELEDRELPVKIGMLGISRGACAAVMTAAHNYSAELVSALVADSAFSTDTTIEWSMKKWAHIFARVRFVYENHKPFFWHFLRWVVLLFASVRSHCKFPSVRKAMAQLKNTPIFFIHGMRDSYIRPEQAKMLFNSAEPPRYLWIVPKAKHNQTVVTQPRIYAERTAAFFEKYLVADKISCINNRANYDNPTNCNSPANRNNTEITFFAGDENRDIPDCPITLSECSNVGTKKKISASLSSDRPDCRLQRRETIETVQEETRPMSPSSK